MTIVQFPDGDVQPTPEPQKPTKRTKQDLVELRHLLWQDRISGKTYQEISRERRIPLRTVIYNVQAAIREMDATSFLEEEMVVSLTQLTKIQELLWPGVLSLDLEQIDVWYKAHDRKMKLLGLEAPKRVDVYAEIVSWAEREGLDPGDVVEATATLLPVPKPPSYPTG